MPPEGYFVSIISGDLITILNNIREAHKKDTTADEDSIASKIARNLKETIDFEGSPQLTHRKGKRKRK